jgi:hypothetical protein
MPTHEGSVLVHTMLACVLSRVRTELDPLRILPTVPPHPIQPNRESSGHGHSNIIASPGMHAKYKAASLPHFGPGSGRGFQLAASLSN